MTKEDYIKELELRCKNTADFFFQEKFEEGPPIGIIGFDNYPRKEEFTYFTYGLHLVGKEEWVRGTPEYFLTIDNGNRNFAVFFAYIMSIFSFEKSMTWGTLLGIDEAAVEGFPYRRIALGQPHYLDWKNYQFGDSDLPINLGMAYLISDADFIEAAQVGFSYLEQMMETDHDYWKKLQHN